MEKLKKIIEKFNGLTYNDNYDLGGGTTDYKFASVRHEDAVFDKGKLTLGQTKQLFKKATGKELYIIDKIIKKAVKNPEWHHAGKLPKNYGGGMKKTYFINSKQIVEIAENFNILLEQIKKEEIEQKIDAEIDKIIINLKHKFLNKYAVEFIRETEIPDLGYVTREEMKGKNGWFKANSFYNTQIYYTGYKFKKGYFTKFLKTNFKKLAIDEYTKKNVKLENTSKIRKVSI